MAFPTLFASSTEQLFAIMHQNLRQTIKQLLLAANSCGGFNFINTHKNKFDRKCQVCCSILANLLFSKKVQVYHIWVATKKSQAEYKLQRELTNSNKQLPEKKMGFFLINSPKGSNSARHLYLNFVNLARHIQSSEPMFHKSLKEKLNCMWLLSLKLFSLMKCLCVFVINYWVSLKIKFH